MTSSQAIYFHDVTAEVALAFFVRLEFQILSKFSQNNLIFGARARQSLVARNGAPRIYHYLLCSQQQQIASALKLQSLCGLVLLPVVKDRVIKRIIYR
jgi:hypothetical protein